MINAMLVISDFTMHFLSAQMDPFAVVTNVNASPVTLDLMVLPCPILKILIMKAHNQLWSC